ncbi:Glycosyl transferase family 2 [Prevotellaceae bacterium KH2P17]|nr:Glycosyl transferase family 2 [Prevotellaceae bacterium KH2P17]
MKSGISFLIPTYNSVCVALVTAIARQAEAIAGFGYEVIVADDGSTQADVIARNEPINNLTNCRYIIRRQNVGRASIRNFLASESQYHWLVFVDSDVQINNPTFVSTYLSATNNRQPVIYGGFKVADEAGTYKHNLRYAYERHYCHTQTLAKRRRHANQHFRSCNFMIRCDVMRSTPMDERMQAYGYEDVMLGKRLKEQGISISHIENPVTYSHFETNKTFVEKTEEAIRTLAHFRQDLSGYSRLDHISTSLRKLYLDTLFSGLFKRTRNRWRSNLCGANPRLITFQLYKLGYYLECLNHKE